MFLFVDKEKLGRGCKGFVIVDAIFTTILCFTIIFKYKKIINSTFGLYISILGMIITIVMILVSGVKHGIFKNNPPN